MWRDLWAYRRRTVVGAAGALVALLAVAVVLALALGGSGAHPGAAATPSAPPATVPSDAPASPSGSAGVSGYDHSPWNTAPSEAPEVSAGFPPLAATGRTQPDLFAAAFGTELLTRDYRHATRDQLLAWAQACSAPLTIQQVPLSSADRRKALVTSLVTPGWDTGEIGTPVPAAGEWLSLRSRQAYTTVTGVAVSTVGDFPPPATTFTEPTLDRLVSATVTLHSMVSGKPVSARFSVAFEVVMTDHAGSYGAAEVQHWVRKRIGAAS